MVAFQRSTGYLFADALRRRGTESISATVKGTRLMYRHFFAARLVVAGALLASVIAVPAATGQVGAQTTTSSVSGRVFNDLAVDGTFDGADIGVEGVEVTAFDAAGAEAGSTQTTADGTYALDLESADIGTVRIEFATPDGFESAFVHASSTTALSSIRFVEPGATDIDYAVYDPDEYCEYSLATICIRQGTINYQPTERVIGLSPFSPPTGTSNPPVADLQDGTYVETLATKAQVGATWGLGYQRKWDLLWNSAVIRRHAGLGTQGIGGVYVFTKGGDEVTSFDLTSLGLVLNDPAVSFADADRDIRDSLGAVGSYGARAYLFLSRDIPGFGAVGKAGIGDLDVSLDGDYLWVTNLYQRKIHRIAINGAADEPTLGAVQSWSVDDGHTCAGSTAPLRPWGIDPQPDGSVIVAAVCTNEGAAPADKELPGDGVILQIDPTQSGASAWTELTTVGFDYAHNYDYCSEEPGYTCTWKAWSDDWTALQTVAKKGSQYWWTQPMIIDIETLPDGSFVLGVSDRMSYQGGNTNYAPTDAVAYQTAWTAGDTLLVCKTDSGWVRESGGDCAGTTNYNSSRSNEFFKDDFGHPETTIGGLAYGNGQIAVSAMDPAAYFVGGVRWVSAVNGNQTNALNLTPVGSSSTSGALGKSSGMGDVEVVCDAAPLQIGNRVWYDLDKNGIQDPDEPPVPGVTLHLLDGEGEVVGTAVTNDEGEYYFSSNVGEDADGGTTPDEFGGGLAAEQTFTIVLDNDDDCELGGPLHGWALTINDATSETSENDDLIDSDAIADGDEWCDVQAPTIDVEEMTIGMVDHSYDIGFNIDRVSVGDYVWLDVNGDGLQDDTDIPLEGVTLSITTAAGDDVTDVLGEPITTTTTDADGLYLFENLPFGQYTVTISTPEGLVPTTANAGDSEDDSSTESETSAELEVDGASDLTLDFGFDALSVSVGDYVWVDINRDGLQDDTDVPLEGVTLAITTAEGGPVIDVFGGPVTTTTTDADGLYTFDDLPPGTYTVTVTPPDGYLPTLEAGGEVDVDSSTDAATSVELVDAGERDPTLDFGFVPIAVSVGDYVWWDTNADGLQDDTDVPLEDVTLSITTVDGDDVVDIYGEAVTTTTTDADGWYSFDNLPVGRYTVTVTAPDGYEPTIELTDAVEADSSTDSVTSVELVEDEQRDPTLDFGFVRTGSSVLPTTGSDWARVLAQASALMGAGALMIIQGRRRRTA
jgi:hypothetical protein